jgi:hypothetical protein
LGAVLEAVLGAVGGGARPSGLHTSPLQSSALHSSGLHSAELHSSEQAGCGFHSAWQRTAGLRQHSAAIGGGAHAVLGAVLVAACWELAPTVGLGPWPGRLPATVASPLQSPPRSGGLPASRASPPLALYVAAATRAASARWPGGGHVEALHAVLPSRQHSGLGSPGAANEGVTAEAVTEGVATW